MLALAVPALCELPPTKSDIADRQDASTLKIEKRGSSYKG